MNILIEILPKLRDNESWVSDLRCFSRTHQVNDELAEIEEMEKSRLNHESRNREFIRNQVRLAQSLKDNEKNDDEKEAEQQPFHRTEEKLQLNLKVKSQQKAQQSSTSAINSVFSCATPSSSASASLNNDGAHKSNGSKRSALEELMDEDAKRLKKSVAVSARKENWLCRDIIVKVMLQDLADGKYYKKKGRIQKVHDKFTAEVEMIDSSDVLKLDQDDLETVIPQISRPVCIVNGSGRGEVGTLLELDLKSFCGRIRIDSGRNKGRILDRVDYEDFCKIEEDPYSERVHAS